MWDALPRLEAVIFADSVAFGPARNTYPYACDIQVRHYGHGPIAFESTRTARF